jgi:hypothetical protein
MSRVVAVTEDRVLDHFYLGCRVDAGFFQGLLYKKLDQAAAVRRIFTHADLAAAQLAHVGNMFGAIPFEKRRVAPAADDVDVSALHALDDR